MLKKDLGFRIIFSLVLLIGLLYIPVPVFSQQNLAIEDLITNGSFENGFQEFGVGYNWGAFSNGQAVVGWNVDTWDKVTPAGQSGTQMIELKDAQERDRYAGIYQTINVVPGQQYKLTINGLIRSSEGNVEASDYGYRLQYGVDHQGGAAWELLANNDWQELTWDEQELFDPEGGVYRFDTYEATITAQSDQLTLFIRGWKKWINNGSGIYNIQSVSLIGPAPAGFEAPVIEAAAVETSAVIEAPAEAKAVEASPAEVAEEETAASEEVEAAEEFSPAADESANDEEAEASSSEAVADSAQQNSAQESTSETQSNAAKAPVMMEAPAISTQPQANVAPLPISGQGEDESINYVVIIGIGLLLILVAGAITATARRRKQPE